MKEQDPIIYPGRTYDRHVIPEQVSLSFNLSEICKNSNQFNDNITFYEAR